MNVLLHCSHQTSGGEEHKWTVRFDPSTSLHRAEAVSIHIQDLLANGECPFIASGYTRGGPKCEHTPDIITLSFVK